MGETEYITEVGPHDVLFGRGSGPNGHDGNVRFRALVNQRKEEYLRTNHRQTKVKIAGEIVDQVLASGGRFLKRVNPADAKGIKSGEVWCAVDHETMMEKAKQALRQNLERHSNKSSNTTTPESSSAAARMNAPRVVTPGDHSLDPYEPDPVREVLPLSMAQQQQLQQQQHYTPANIAALTDYATAQVNSSSAAYPTSSQQQKVNSLSELTGSVEISNLIQSIVNVRKDEYFCASDPQTKALIAREIVDAALAESNRARQNNNMGYDTSMLQQQQQQQNLGMPPPAAPNSMGPPPHRPVSSSSNSQNRGLPPAGGGGGGFNLYTMAAGRERTSSGTNQYPPNAAAGIQPPHTGSGGYQQQLPPKPTQGIQPGLPTDDQSMDEYQMMLEQYLSNTLTPGDSNSNLGITDQDSIGTFNQSDAGELESMAESASLMSFSSKAKNKGGIDSYLSANAPGNRHSKRNIMSSASSRNSRKSAGLKAHFMLEDQKKGKSRATMGNSSVMSSSIMSGKSHRSTKSNKSSKSSVKDDMSIMSGISNFSGMSNNDDHLSLMSEMTDLSEALNSLDLAGDYSQILK